METEDKRHLLPIRTKNRIEVHELSEISELIQIVKGHQDGAVLIDVFKNKVNLELSENDSITIRRTHLYQLSGLLPLKISSIEGMNISSNEMEVETAFKKPEKTQKKSLFLEFSCEDFDCPNRAKIKGNDGALVPLSENGSLKANEDYEELGYLGIQTGPGSTNFHFGGGLNCPEKHTCAFCKKEKVLVGEECLLCKKKGTEKKLQGHLVYSFVLRECQAIVVERDFEKGKHRTLYKDLIEKGKVMRILPPEDIGNLEDIEFIINPEFVPTLMCQICGEELKYSKNLEKLRCGHRIHRECHENNKKALEKHRRTLEKKKIKPEDLCWLCYELF